ncbi:hypothetical protein BWQ96_08887 [Gracilariopsis chorda]|uniref:Uncharacterized protein n=1 Tax=Gracilariopsis chorda TaxID=448386 RepID=A0A2V3IH41_9FLOR|nr:hypothetical protein BWQ96_08887 [Gracilariopsis chorda]|eukprot:PXF41389.1 hypothetical protein BWQ96_08887 [Gracilariopsis chorda]
MDSGNAQSSSQEVLHNQGSLRSQVSPKHTPFSLSVPVTTEDSKELSTFTFVDSDEDATLRRPQPENIETSEPSEGHNLPDKERTKGKNEGINLYLKQEDSQMPVTKKPKTSSVVSAEAQKPDMTVTSEPVGKVQSATKEQRSTQRDSTLFWHQKSEKRNSTTVNAEKGTRSNHETIANLQRRAKSLSFLEETSPRKVGDIGSYAGTAITEASSPSSRMRGRTASRVGSKQKRSQTPAAPAINLSDYGSDDDIEAADLAESVCVYDGALGRKKVQKPSLRLTKQEEKMSSILRQRKLTTEIQQTPSCAPSRQNSQNSKISQRARVSFQTKEGTIPAVRETKPKIQCHTPFPRGNLKLLASESEDSDDLSFQESRISNSERPSLKPVDDYRSNSLGNLKEDAMPIPPAPFRSPTRAANGICFTQYPNVMGPRRNYPHKSRESAQVSCFVRIGGRRNILTFEPAIETTNILPAAPTTSKPALVPGSYCSSCGHRVIDA